jgi:hypothetical protein
MQPMLRVRSEPCHIARYQPKHFLGEVLQRVCEKKCHSGTDLGAQISLKWNSCAPRSLLVLYVGAAVSAWPYPLFFSTTPIVCLSPQLRYSYSSIHTGIMTDTSSSRLELLFDAALESYEKQTGTKLTNHPFARQLENCYTVDDIMDFLQQRARAFSAFRGEDGKVMKSLKQAVHILHSLSTSTTLGEGVGLVRRTTVLRFPNSLLSI